MAIIHQFPEAGCQINLINRIQVAKPCPGVSEHSLLPISGGGDVEDWDMGLARIKT